MSAATATTSPRWVAKPPTNEGTYYEQFGWTVTDPRTGLVACSGNEATTKKYARAMNARDDL